MLNASQTPQADEQSKLQCPLQMMQHLLKHAKEPSLSAVENLQQSAAPSQQMLEHCLHLSLTNPPNSMRGPLKTLRPFIIPGTLQSYYQYTLLSSIRNSVQKTMYYLESTKTEKLKVNNIGIKTNPWEIKTLKEI
jgi:hypothetical protein